MYKIKSTNKKNVQLTKVKSTTKLSTKKVHK